MLSMQQDSNDRASAHASRRIVIRTAVKRLCDQQPKENTVPGRIFTASKNGNNFIIAPEGPSTFPDGMNTYEPDNAFEILQYHSNMWVGQRYMDSSRPASTLLGDAEEFSLDRGASTNIK